MVKMITEHAARTRSDFVNVVILAGRYTDEVTDFAGRFVKDCDIDIVKMLVERGLLLSKEKL